MPGIGNPHHDITIGDDVSECEACGRTVNWSVNTRCPNLECPSRGDV